MPAASNPGDRTFFEVTPNPLRAGSVFRYRIPVDQTNAVVSLGIYDAQGRRLHTFPGGSVGGGLYESPWDGRAEGGRRLPPGVYFARLESGGEAKTIKVMVAP